MPRSGATVRVRSFRLSDDVWQAACESARERDEPVGALIRAAIGRELARRRRAAR